MYIYEIWKQRGNFLHSEELAIPLIDKNVLLYLTEL